MNTKVSIITVCFNAEESIQKTIESVLEQTSIDFEYLIIDGKSTDSTIKIAKNYEEKFLNKKINYNILSEKDSGIFDAMNKGVKMACGDWIVFMNSGDRFADEKVLSDVLANKIESHDVVYGDLILSDGKYLRKMSCSPLENILIEMPFCHQCTFTKRVRLIEHPFNTNYKYTSDYDFFLNLYLNDGKFKYIPRYIAIYEQFGVSDNFDTRKQFVNIQLKNGVIKKVDFKIKFFLLKMKIILWLRYMVRKYFSKIYFSPKRGWYEYK